jgi:hypothetical protein
MKKILPLFIFLTTHVVTAQDSLWVTQRVPKNAIKFSPLHLINFYPTIELSYERRIKNEITMQAELGYVLNNPENSNTQYRDERGVKIKLEPRYYFSKAKKSIVLYGAAEVYANIINFDRVRYKTECFDGDCMSQYRERVAYKVRYREEGFSVKCGFVKYVGNFFIDFNTGWTTRFIKYHEPDFGITQSTDDNLSFLSFTPNERNRIGLSPAVGARLGYRFN